MAVGLLHIPTRFGENCPKTFRVILSTDRQTNKRKDGGDYITSSAEDYCKWHLNSDVSLRPWSLTPKSKLLNLALALT